MVITDVDGVLTDGRLIYGSNGTEYKSFHVHDGYGIARGQAFGLLFAIISGRFSKATTYRARRIQIADCIQGAEDKVAACKGLLKKHRLQFNEVCYIGDDEFDIPLLNHVGVSIAPADAIEVVRKEVDYVTRVGGGRGAVREVVDMILRAKNLL